MKGDHRTELERLFNPGDTVWVVTRKQPAVILCRTAVDYVDLDLGGKTKGMWLGHLAPIDKFDEGGE